MTKFNRADNPFGLIDPFFNDFFLNKKTMLDNQILKTDIKEESDHYLIKIDMPEIKKSDINLSLENGYLSVSAEIKKEENQETGRYIRRERRIGRFSREFYVGDNVKEEDIRAKLEDGVLTLTLFKKVEEAKTIKKIEIE